jgi:hypothetical protein
MTRATAWTRYSASWTATHVGAGDLAVLQDLGRCAAQSSSPSIKIDLPRRNPDAGVQKLQGVPFDQIVPVSARRGDGMDELLALIKGAMPEGPKYFPDDIFTGPAGALLVAEIIREKALLNLREEIPYTASASRCCHRGGQTLTEIPREPVHRTGEPQGDHHRERGAMLGKIGAEDAERHRAPAGTPAST